MSRTPLWKESCRSSPNVGLHEGIRLAKTGTNWRPIRSSVLQNRRPTTVFASDFQTSRPSRFAQTITDVSAIRRDLHFETVSSLCLFKADFVPSVSRTEASRATPMIAFCNLTNSLSRSSPPTAAGADPSVCCRYTLMCQPRGIGAELMDARRSRLTRIRSKFCAF
jgi:hypothetical protein